ncbi:MAG: eukaryotic-like serine/threonine-protein kinase [Acidobacteriota bacterium]|jgi:serine/threonine protein kinase|nr:eukaryotic-like serine/threonine-protein kinase [Acidobacteriota bacterium]
MNGISDAALHHLREVADEPDLSGTPYEIVETLGRGGMGTVYLARDLRLDREVALKVVQLPEGTGDLERLLREARVLARLEHPGIVPVHDAGLLPCGRAFYAMKRVRGQQLDEYARAAPLPERLRAFERICEAVAFAHAHGVIHRDLKPENVMVGPFGEVLVMDWGVAKVAPHLVGAFCCSPSSPGDEGLGRGRSAAKLALMGARGEGSGGGTEAGTILGTPGYMPPEQERGEVDRIDERADVWALGALLGFLLKGKEPPPRPLEAIRRRAMATEPAQRYPQVEELAADLSRYLAGLRVDAHQETVLERAGRFVRRYRTPILLILAYLVMRVLLIFFLDR